MKVRIFYIASPNVDIVECNIAINIDSKDIYREIADDFFNPTIDDVDEALSQLIDPNGDFGTFYFNEDDEDALLKELCKIHKEREENEELDN